MLITSFEVGINAVQIQSLTRSLGSEFPCLCSYYHDKVEKFLEKKRDLQKAQDITEQDEFEKLALIK